MVYRRLATEEAQRLIDWAEENDVDWDIWNAAESFMGAAITELGLERWPD